MSEPSPTWTDALDAVLDQLKAFEHWPTGITRERFLSWVSEGIIVPPEELPPEALEAVWRRYRGVDEDELKRD